MSLKSQLCAEFPKKIIMNGCWCRSSLVESGDDFFKASKLSLIVDHFLKWSGLIAYFQKGPKHDPQSNIKLDEPFSTGRTWYPESPGKGNSTGCEWDSVSPFSKSKCRYMTCQIWTSFLTNSRLTFIFKTSRDRNYRCCPLPYCIARYNVSGFTCGFRIITKNAMGK